MKVLYIHQYFKTPEEGGAIRSYYLASALAKAGHEVHLITGSNKHKGKKTIEGINVYYLAVKYDNRYGFIKRILAFLKFVSSAYLQAVKIKKVDICYATSTPLSVGIIALALKKIHKIPYHFEVRDLWPKVPEEMGYIRNPILKHLLRKLEGIMYKNANQVISLSPGIANYIKSTYNQSTILIPNICDCEFFHSEDRKCNSSLVNIAYIGAMGKANDLMALIAIAKHCKDENIPDVNFSLAGDGSEKDLILCKIKNEGLDNVEYLGTLNKLEIRDLLRRSDAIYVSFADFEILSTSSPNKFFDGLAASNIILTNTNGWMEELISANECGFYIDRKTPQNFITEVIPHLRNAEKRSKMQKNAYLLAKSSFDRPLLEKRFLELFRE